MNYDWTDDAIKAAAERGYDCLFKAVDKFNEHDCETLLCPTKAGPYTAAEYAAASERSIAHRLAYHWECEMRTAAIITKENKLAVDCEYNRHIGEEKTLAGDDQARIARIVKEARDTEVVPDEDGFCVFSIAPDIILHQRGKDVNLVVVELKKRTNREAAEYDLLKLELFTRPREGSRGFGYLYGVWIIAEDKCSPRYRYLKIERVIA
jgi:hypothetical protein